MYALIQKSDNKILQVSNQFAELSELKPFQWVECDDEVTAGWAYDGDIFTAPIIPVYQPTLAELSEAVRNALQSAIDVKARSFGFSGGNALMLYAGFLNPFQPLAQVFATWEASVWVEADAYKQEVLLGQKPMLTGDEAVALMPEYPA